MRSGLTCAIWLGRDGAGPEPSLTLERTEFAQPVDIDGATTPAGIIARLEHIIERMDAELDEQRRRVAEAQTRLAGYAPRLGEAFPLQGELDARLVQLAAIEADLAGTDDTVNENRALERLRSYA